MTNEGMARSEPVFEDSRPTRWRCRRCGYATSGDSAESPLDQGKHYGILRDSTGVYVPPDGAGTEQNLSPGVLDLLAENRILRGHLGEVRERLAWLVGRYERSGTAIPLFEIDDLLSERWPS